MPAGLPDVALFSILVADDTTLGYFQNASFPTTNSFIFHSPFDLDKHFFDSLKNKGYMPFRRWSLFLVDSALKEVGRYTWDQTRVTRIGFPALENQSSKPLRFSVLLAVAGVTHTSPDNRAAASNFFSGSRTQDGVGCIFQLKMDGLEAAEWNVSKIGAFKLGAGMSEDLVLTVSPEGLADPFRDWLKNGSSPRGGTLICMRFNFHIFFRVRFTCLRVRTITPALSTYSSSPATIHLSYSDISFGDK
jgi:hypothetical protein